MSALVILLASGIDIALGWPGPVFRRVSHPVVWIGALITWLDDRFNPTGREAGARLRGVAVVAIVLMASVGPAVAIVATLPEGYAGTVVAALLAWPFLAFRSMYDHVRAVAVPLSRGDMFEARQAVSMIVGRDPARLDASGVSRAALESLAENTSDGIVAPVFWGVLLGLPGLVAYKAINTMDSMIGHRTPRHLHFGWAAARLDDAVNVVPARLTGLLFALASSAPRRAMTVMRRDAPHHRSPNAGWPEAAMAAALDVRLSGPRIYGTTIADEPWLNARRPDPDGADVAGGLRLYVRAMAGLLGILAALAFIGALDA